MRIAIFSDIHGNREALISIINDIKKENINETICLGDVIGIGPKPKECLDIIIDNNIKMVLGNHELYSLKGTEIDSRLDESEIEHLKWTKEQVATKQKEYLEKCNLKIERDFNGKKILFEHFLIDNNTNSKFPFYDLEIIKDGSINKTVESLEYDLIFIGHEHNDFCVENKLYDVGSSGCTKNNITRYTILDTETLKVETKKIEYDRKSFEKDLLEIDYPDRKLLVKWFFGIEL